MAKVLAAIVTVAVLAAYLVAMFSLGQVRARFAPLDVRFPASDGPQTWAIIGEDEPDESMVKGQSDGSRADIILLVTATPSGTTVTSVPRDISLTWNKQPVPARLAVNWVRGPQSFVDAMCHGLGIPIDHVVRVDIEAFKAIVDGVGGIDITLAEPLRQQGLLSLPAGPAHLDGDAALRYVRMRHAQVPRDGAWVEQPDGPRRRQERSVQVFEQVLSKSRHDPRAGARAFRGAVPLVGVDRDMVWRDMIPLARYRGPVRYLPANALSDMVAEPTDETRATIQQLGYSGCSR